MNARVKSKTWQILRYSSLGIFLLVALAVSAVWINKKVIVAEAVSLIERRTGAHLHFDEARLRFTFPFTGIYLDQLNIRNDEGETWLHASRVFLRLNAWSLLRDDYRFPYLKIEGAELRHHVDMAGLSNIPFSRQQSNTSGGSKPVGIRKISLEEVSIIVIDDQHEFHQRFDIHDATLKVEVDGPLISGKIRGEGHSGIVRSGEQRYALDMPLGFDLDLSLDQEARFLSLRESSLTSQEDQINIRGEVGTDSKDELLELWITSKQFNPERWTGLLPPDLIPMVEAKGISGQCDISLHVWQGTERLMTELESDCREVTLDRVIPGKKVSLQDTRFNYSNTESTSGRVHIHEVHALMEGAIVEGKGILHDLFDPVFTGTIRGAVEPAQWLSEVQTPVFVYSGSVTIDSALFDQVKLKDADLMSEGIRLFAAADKLEVEFRETRFGLDGGAFSWHTGELEWTDCQLYGEGLDLSVSGSIPFAEGKPTPYQHFDIQLDGKSLDLKAYAPILFTEGPPEKVRKVNTRDELSPVLDRGNINFSIGEIHWDKIMSDKTVGYLSLSPESLKFKGEALYAQGFMDAEGELSMKKNAFTGKVRTHSTELSEIFRQWQNFGQEVITMDHLSGKVSGWYFIEWDNPGDWKKENLDLYGVLDLNEGRLKDLKMMEQFSSYIHAEDLQDIRFTRLRNMFCIEDGTLHIPRMFIRSNAANLTIGGQHSLDNEIRYHLRINAGQVLAEKMKKHDPALRPLKPNKKGMLNLHYTIAGTMDDFVYYSGKRDVKSYFSRSFDLRSRIRDKMIHAFPDIPIWIETDIWNDIPEIDQGDDPLEYMDQ